MGPPGGILGRRARFFGSCSLSWAPLGAFLGLSWAVLGASWAVLALPWAVLGLSRGSLGPSWGGLRGLLGRLGASESRISEKTENIEQKLSASSDPHHPPPWLVRGVRNHLLLVGREGGVLVAVCPSRESTAERTASWWPPSAHAHSPESADQIRAVRSREAVNTCRPSGEKMADNKPSCRGRPKQRFAFSFRFRFD